MSLASEALIGVGLWITRREQSEERDDLAVQSVLAALNATMLYLARREAGEPIDREAEPELVELWTSASVHIRRTDFDLAQRLEEKADYWTNPEHWSAEERAINGRQVDTIADKAMRLLGTT